MWMKKFCCTNYVSYLVCNFLLVKGKRTIFGHVYILGLIYIAIVF